LFERWFRQQDWCCQPFRELLEARHGRELFVFVRPPGWGPCLVPTFWLAFRSIRQKDLPRLPRDGLPPDMPVTLSTCRRIFRCPWCGVELEGFYRGHWQEGHDPVIVQEFELPVSSEGSAEPAAAPDRPRD
jgi:hypothetical protein